LPLSKKNNDAKADRLTVTDPPIGRGKTIALPNARVKPSWCLCFQTSSECHRWVFATSYSNSMWAYNEKCRGIHSTQLWGCRPLPQQGHAMGATHQDKGLPKLQGQRAPSPLISPSGKEGTLRVKEASRRLTWGRPHNSRHLLTVKRQTVAVASWCTTLSTTS
jgi:hypothetical protein